MPVGGRPLGHHPVVSELASSRGVSVKDFAVVIHETEFSACEPKTPAKAVRA